MTVCCVCWLILGAVCWQNMRTVVCGQAAGQVEEAYPQVVAVGLPKIAQFTLPTSVKPRQSFLG